MSTITREQAKDLRNAFQCWQQDYDPVEDKEQYDMFGLGMVAMDALLASLEAEPVAYIRDGFRADGVHFCGGIITAEEHERTKPALSDRYNWKHQPLYTAPQAPVAVPTFDEWLEIRGNKPLGWVKDAMRESYDACRATMLQGAEPVTTAYKLPANTPCKDAPEHIWLQTAGVWPENGEFSELTWCSDNQHTDDTLYVRADVVADNSPVVPDGYALVPVEPTAEMQSAAAGVIRFDTTPINKFWTGNAVYRAMIAAAPQREVK